jgi:hypothetical protein
MAEMEVARWKTEVANRLKPTVLKAKIAVSLSDIKSNKIPLASRQIASYSFLEISDFGSALRQLIIN